MTDRQKDILKTLRSKMADLDEWGQDFSKSILSQIEEKGWLSGRQWDWAAHLAGMGPRPAPKQNSNRYYKKKENTDSSSEVAALRKKLAQAQRALTEAKEEIKTLEEKAKPWEDMLRAFRGATKHQQKLVKRSMHPDSWNVADWATKAFQAANR